MNAELIYGHDWQVAHTPSPDVISVVRSLPKQGQKTAADPALVAIVEDDQPVRKSLERLVKSSGFRVQGFASAEDFLLSRDGPHHLRPQLTGHERSGAWLPNAIECRSFSYISPQRTREPRSSSASRGR